MGFSWWNLFLLLFQWNWKACLNSYTAAISTPFSFDFCFQDILIPMLCVCVLRVYVCYQFAVWILNQVLKSPSLDLNKHVLPTGINADHCTCFPFLWILDLYQSYISATRTVFLTFLLLFFQSLLSITNLSTLILIHLGLSCLGFTDLVFFFFFQELKDISYLINCFINTVIGSICLNNSMKFVTPGTLFSLFCPWYRSFKPSFHSFR